MNQGPCTNRLPALPVSSQSRGEDDRPSVSRNSPPIPNSASWFWTATDGPRADRCEVTRRLPGSDPQQPRHYVRVRHDRAPNGMSTAQHGTFALGYPKSWPAGDTTRSHSSCSELSKAVGMEKNPECGATDGIVSQ